MRILIFLLLFSVAYAKDMEITTDGTGMLQITCTGEELNIRDFKSMEDYLWRAKATPKGAYIYMDGPASFRAICPKKGNK